MEKLSEEKIMSELSQLTGWSYADGSIRKTFSTKNFVQTMGLAAALGTLCQQHDHHPDYMTIKYSSIDVSFSTHSVKGITSKDIEIARDIESINITAK